MKLLHPMTSIRDPDEARRLCQAYFDSLAKTKWAEVWDPDVPNEDGSLGRLVHKEVPDGYRVPGVAGLAVALGMDRRSLLNWCKRGDDDNPVVVEISQILRAAKSAVEAAQEEALFDRETARGAMFALQSIYRWGVEDQNEAPTEFKREILPPIATGDALAVPKWEPE